MPCLARPQPGLAGTESDEAPVLEDRTRSAVTLYCDMSNLVPLGLIRVKG